MTLRSWLIPAIGVAALGFLAAPGKAAPVGAVTGAGSDLRIAASENASIEQVHGRRYRYYRHYGYFRPYRYHRPYRYYGFRPGIHFYFGPRRHYRHYRRYHW